MVENTSVEQKLSSPPPSIEGLIQRSKVLICVGTGGVGKTTTAAAVGVRAAEMGLKALVLTIDPAKRLATALGLDELNNPGLRTSLDPVQVSLDAPGELWAMLLNSQLIFDRFLQAQSADPKLFERISKNELYVQMSTRLSGSQEFTALEMLLRLYESKVYDLIVLDTPPAQHAVDFLTAPKRIQALFQDSITKWFMNPDSQDGLISLPLIGAIVGRGTRVALRSLEILTGGRFIEALIDFFASVRAVQGKIRERLGRVEQILHAPDVQFALVTGFESAKLREAAGLASLLQSQGYHFEALIVNRAFVIRPDVGRAQPQTESGRKLVELYTELAQDHELRLNAVDQIRLQIAENASKQFVTLRVPQQGHDVVGVEDLKNLSLVFSRAHL